MRGITMSFAPPEAVREDVVQRVRFGPYGNTNGSMRERVRRDHGRQAPSGRPGRKR
jgi:hypothetical protein